MFFPDVRSDVFQEGQTVLLLQERKDVRSILTTKNFPHPVPVGILFLAMPEVQCAVGRNHGHGGCSGRDDAG